MSDLPHVYVATPAYDGKVDVAYSQSLANAAWHAAVLGIRVTAAVMGNGAFIELARNIFVKFFLELEDLKSCTHMMFIDSDLKFDANAFCGLVNVVNEKRPMVAGVYPRRQEDTDYPAKWWPEPELTKAKGEDCLWIDEDGYLKCKRVPTGFLCMHRSLIEDMANDPKTQWLDIHGQDGPVPWLFETHIDSDARFVGEDFTFCDKVVKKYGKPIDVWMDFDFVHGGYEGNYLAHLDGQVKEQKERVRAPRKLGGRRNA
ncbi:MAG: hypothetical protein GOVbin7744_32 [Prokaryotic dsDNA virus sp.]|nr:MAG: hypothetical protein GOVbin7744_32 [Prokaryotic dsDNA virus sp.]|tara:strand:+ start:16272 stop:17045 length:774 start_codon:yes stop_codon:yes gene_type:complete